MTVVSAAYWVGAAAISTDPDDGDWAAGNTEQGVDVLNDDTDGGEQVGSSLGSSLHQMDISLDVSHE